MTEDEKKLVDETVLKLFPKQKTFSELLDGFMRSVNEHFHLSLQMDNPLLRSIAPDKNWTGAKLIVPFEMKK